MIASTTSPLGSCCFERSPMMLFTRNLASHLDLMYSRISVYHVLAYSPPWMVRFGTICHCPSALLFSRKIDPIFCARHRSARDFLHFGPLWNRHSCSFCLGTHLPASTYVSLNQVPEAGGVVRMFQVAEFMDQDVTSHLTGEKEQVPVQVDVPLPRAAPPQGLLTSDRHPVEGQR